MPLAEDVRLILDELAALGLPHMVVGALAVDAWGVPRTTLDIDLQVALPAPPDKLKSVYLGLIVEEWSRDRTFDQDVLIGTVGSPVPIEMFVTSHWFTRQALDRRVSIRSALVGRDVPVPRLEDLILLKAAYHAAPWRSRTKAAQDAVDIENLAAFAAGLDIDHVAENAKKLGVWRALEPILLSARRADEA